MNEYQREWFDKANNDLISAKHLFRQLFPPQIEISAYLCQQCIEKSLKGYLVGQDIEPDRTHDLELLCKKCEMFDSRFEQFLNVCKNITPFATQGRYPSNIEITKEQAEYAIDKATEIHSFAQVKMREIIKT